MSTDVFSSNMRLKQRTSAAWFGFGDWYQNVRRTCKVEVYIVS